MPNVLNAPNAEPTAIPNAQNAEFQTLIVPSVRNAEQAGMPNSRNAECPECPMQIAL